MAQEVLSNRDRRKLKKKTSAKPRVVAGDATVRVAAQPAATPAAQPTDRDGLAWLARKRWITAPQARKALYYRDLVRAAPDGAIKVVDLNSAGGGGGKGGGLPMGGSFGDAQAALELHVIRQFVLGGEDDLLLAMDGVCGRGHTLRYLAGNNQLRSHELLGALRIALNLMIAADRAKEMARTARNKAA